MKDGRGTRGLRDPEIELGEHDRYAAVRGLRGDLRAHVHVRRAAGSTPTRGCIDTDGAVIPGLYAAGELVGGLFYFNYPGGTGLMNGAVFGRHRRHVGRPARRTIAVSAFKPLQAQ